MAKMSDFSNHNIIAYILASCANLNLHPVYTYAWRASCSLIIKNYWMRLSRISELFRQRSALSAEAEG